MTRPDARRLLAAVDATWPPAGVVRRGNIVLRDGQGGGKRVSAATAETRAAASDISAAQADMLGMGQSALFMIRQGEDWLDADLDARGYRIVDPVVLMTVPVAQLTDRPIPRLTTFCIWEPLAVMLDIWARGGVGPRRIDVMARAKRKTAVLARWNNRPAGTGFVAVNDDIAMVHAVEVLPEHRRQGVAGWIMRQAAFWAREQGAETLAVLCTRDNEGALGLYSGLGFEAATGYHYRQLPNAGENRDG